MSFIFIFVWAIGMNSCFVSLRGGSVSADVVASLLEWAGEVGDEAKAGWLEHELYSTGKGAYLAHLNRPTC